MFSAAVAASLGRKGKFGILWLAATVGSHERSLPKNELVKLNLTEACEQIVAGEAAVPGAPPTPSPSPPSSELSSEEEQEEGRKRKKKAKPRKKKRPVKKRKAAEEEEEGEKVVIGLRVRANLMLGVCRVYDLQVSVTSSDATHLFLSLRPMLSDYGKGGKAGVTGGPRQLDMPDDGGARANTSNLDAPEENMLGFGLDFGMAAGFGGDEWDKFEFGEPVSSVGKATTLSLSTRTEEEEEEEGEEGELPRARARPSGKPSTIGSPSRITLHEPHLYAGSEHRPSEGPEVEFEPGVEGLGLGLLGEEEMAMDFEGGPYGRGAPSSSVGGLGLGMGEEGYQYPEDGAGFDFGMDEGGQPMEGIEPEMRPIEERSEVTEESSLASILKGPAAGKPKKKKTVKLAKMDEELTFSDAIIKGWRKDYVKNMIQQGNVAKEKHKEKSARDAAVGMLQGIPVGGVQAPELVDLVLGQQNKKKSFITTPKPRTKRKRKPVAEGEGSEIEVEEGEEEQPYAYPADDFDHFDMGDVQPMEEEHEEKYVDYSIPLKGDETRRSEEEESEVGRRAGSSRKSSVAPWDSAQRRGRESSIGLLGEGGFGPGSSSYGRPSTTGRPSFAAESVFAGRRYQRAGSHVSSLRSASVERLGRPSRAGTEDGLEAAYPEAEMLHEEGYLPEGEEVVETFALERQSYAFLEYLKKMIFDLPKPSPIINEEGEDEAQPLLSIDFSVLVPVESCTPSAAAKGFYQCLVLCTKDIIGLSQEEDFGEITVRLK